MRWMPPRILASSSSWWMPGGIERAPIRADFTTGIGVWEADPDRFPSGLSALSDHAHELGMKFGIWVEPERVDLKTVGKAGLAKERWLATQSGRLRSGEDQRHCEFRSALPGQHRGARLDSRSPLGADRCGAPRLPEMGQQFLGQLHALGTRPRIRRRKFHPRVRVAAAPRDVARPLPRPPD